MASEPAECEGGTTSEVFRHIESAADAQVGARTRRLDGTERECLPGTDRHGCPVRHGDTVQCRLHARAREHDYLLGSEPKRRPGHRHLQRGGPGRISHGAIAEPMRMRIHGPRGGDPDGPIPEPTRVILY